MDEQAYVEGFVKQCNELGVDPGALGLEKKGELELLTDALPRMEPNDLAIVEGFVKECAAWGADPEEMLKVAILPLAGGLGNAGAAGGGNAVKGVWNKYVGGRDSLLGQGMAGLVGGAKGLWQGGASGMRAGAQQGVQNYQAQNAQQRNLGGAQLNMAGAQFNKNVAAPLKALGQDATTVPRMAGAWAGGLVGAGGQAANQQAMGAMRAGANTMSAANQRYGQAQTQLAAAQNPTAPAAPAAPAAPTGPAAGQNPTAPAAPAAPAAPTGLAPGWLGA